MWAQPWPRQRQRAAHGQLFSPQAPSLPSPRQRRRLGRSRPLGGDVDRDQTPAPAPDNDNGIDLVGGCGTGAESDLDQESEPDPDQIKGTTLDRGLVHGRVQEGVGVIKHGLHPPIPGLPRQSRRASRRPRRCRGRTRGHTEGSGRRTWSGRRRGRGS